jgi:hypothetical protein
MGLSSLPFRLPRDIPMRCAVGLAVPAFLRLYNILREDGLVVSWRAGDWLQGDWSSGSCLSLLGPWRPLR